MAERGDQLPALGFLIGVALVVASLIVSRTFLNIKKMDNVITVSGSAKQQVSADSARWTSSFSRTVYQDGLRGGYAQMKSDENAVKEFLKSQGFTDVEISPVFMNEVYNYKSDQGGPKQYMLIQNVQVRSNDVQKMKELAKNTDRLAEKGVLFSTGPVEYYYSKLADLRVSMLPDAIKDAKKRAEAIAGSSDKKVDSVKSVAMGVVQVMPVGTLDVSDYGSYDTSQIDKEVMVTVKATFALK